MTMTDTMRSITVDIDIFYYIEEEYLTWHCPQFALYGVTPYRPNGEPLQSFALETLEKKVNTQAERSGGGERFLEALIEQGHWVGDDIGNARPKPVERYISSQPILAKLVNLPGSSSSRHSYTVNISQ